MIHYTEGNREAWNEVFDKHQVNWIKNPIVEGLKEKFAYLVPDMANEFKNIGFEDKNVCQFCCNNGRELMSVVKSGAKSGTGFDISDKFVEEANRCAKLISVNCKFVRSSVLEIDDKFKNQFDILFCTIGTLCWFKRLDEFFEKVNFVLKPNGIVLINDTHPLTNCFAMESESEYDINRPEKIVYSYFKNDEWITTEGLDYYNNTKYDSKPFVSYAHTLSDIIDGMVKNGIHVEKLHEFNYSLHGFGLLNNGMLPLSMIIRGKKGKF
jgi:SAM-dependent methyltransferase